MCGLKHQKEKRSMDNFAGLDCQIASNSDPLLECAPGAGQVEARELTG